MRTYTPPPVYIRGNPWPNRKERRRLGLRGVNLLSVMSGLRAGI